MTEGSGLESYYETVYVATLDNNSSAKTSAKRRHRQKKEHKKKEKKKEKKSHSQRRDTDTGNEVKDCPFCKKFECRKAHTPILHDKCMWNKKYNGYRFKSICDKFEVDFKPRQFSSKMDGFKDAKFDKESK